MNTKERHLEILTAAVNVLDEIGGVEYVDMYRDTLTKEDSKTFFRNLAKAVQRKTGCHLDTAKRNLAKAMRRARWQVLQGTPKDQISEKVIESALKGWGGSRGGGRPRKGEMS